MRRRAYLGGLVSVAVAGCMGKNSTSANAGGDRETEPDSSSSTTEKSPAVVVLESEMVTVEDHNDTNPAVQATVKNQSATTVGDLTLFADFLDRDGNVVDTEDHSLIELESGYKWETTIVRKYGGIEVHDYDIRIEHDQGPATVPDGVTVGLASTEVQANQALTDVLVENHSDKKRWVLAGAQFVGGGFVVDEYYDINNQVPVGKTWRFDTEIEHEGNVEQVRPFGYGY